MERHKMGYVLAAAVVAFFLTAVDAVPREMPEFLHLSDLAQAILLYLIYLSLRHPKLPALNEAILRVLYSFGLMVFIMAVHYGISFLAGGSSMLPLPAVFAFAWLVVVFMNPVRGFLRGLLRKFFPAAKRIFQSFRMKTSKGNGPSSWRRWPRASPTKSGTPGVDQGRRGISPARGG